MHTSATWGVVALVAIALWSCLCGASIQANYPCSIVGQWQQVGLGSGSNLTMTFNSTRFYTFNVSILSATRCVRAQSHRHIVACAWLCVCVCGRQLRLPSAVSAALSKRGCGWRVPTRRSTVCSCCSPSLAEVPRLSHLQKSGIVNLVLSTLHSTPASPCCGCNMIERNAEIYYGPDCNTMHLNGLVCSTTRLHVDSLIHCSSPTFLGPDRRQRSSASSKTRALPRYRVDATPGARLLGSMICL
jgi:hypothetical protein